eukprot:6463102-Amphidinium_carterae.3
MPMVWVEVPRSDFAAKDVKAIARNATIKGVGSARIDSLDLLIGRLVHAYQVRVVEAKSHGKPNEEDRMYRYDGRDGFMLQCFEELSEARRIPCLRCNHSKLKESRCHNEHIQDARGRNKTVE